MAEDDGLPVTPPAPRRGEAATGEDNLVAVVEAVATDLARTAAQAVAYGNHAEARRLRRYSLRLTRALPALASSSATEPESAS